MIAVIQPIAGEQAAGHSQWLQFCVDWFRGNFGLVGSPFDEPPGSQNRIRNAKDEFLAVLSRIESELHTCEHVDDRAQKFMRLRSLRCVPPFMRSSHSSGVPV